MARYFVGLTGASGHPYARALLRALAAGGHEVSLAVTPAGAKVMRHELGVDPGPAGARLGEVLDELVGPELGPRLRAFAADAVEAPPSSGTALTGGVVLAPCSMGTIARVAAGFSSNLVERAADVALKEGRPLLVVARETPLSEIHLENLLKLARLGAAIVPASPGFYHHPRSIDDLIDHVVGKVLDRLGVEHAGVRWSGRLEPPPEPGTTPPAAGGGEAEAG